MNIYVILSSFISGALGAMGFGGGTVLIIYLTSFLNLEQKEAQGINLVFFIITGIFALWNNSKNKLVDTAAVKKVLPLSLPGLIIGYMLLPIIPTSILGRLFGGVLLILGIKELFSKKKCTE